MRFDRLILKGNCPRPLLVIVIADCRCAAGLVDFIFSAQHLIQRWVRLAFLDSCADTQGTQTYIFTLIVSLSPAIITIQPDFSTRSVAQLLIPGGVAARDTCIIFIEREYMTVVGIFKRNWTVYYIYKARRRCCLVHFLFVGLSACTLNI